MVTVGLLTLDLRLPGCASLKEKRGRLKPLLAHLHREFNISAAELDHLDAWGEAIVACAVVSNDPAQVQRILQKVVNSVESSWLDVEVWDEKIEIL